MRPREKKIKETFDKVGLNCWVAEKPIVRTDDERIFQMTIRKERTTKREHFGIYCGGDTNEVRVLGSDAKHKQVLLMVKEPKRKFSFFVTERVKEGNRMVSKRVRKTDTTDPSMRKYLIRLDESHYFIAQLPLIGPLNTVEQAHDVLRPPKVERRMRSTRRQGEWFFVPASASEKRKVRQEAKKAWLILRNHPLVPSLGHPHHAEEHIQVRIGKVFIAFVRGRIKHPDHKVLKLDDWHRVYLNRELRQPMTNTSVWGWVD